MTKFSLYSKTLFRLGFVNIIQVLIYRLKLKLGYFSLKKSAGIDLSDEFIPPIWGSLDTNDFGSKLSSAPINLAAQKLMTGEIILFNHQKYQTSAPPEWFFHPEYSMKQHWSKSLLQLTPGHDVKLTWDISRFQWIVLFALAYKNTRDVVYLNEINKWCKDWVSHNPAFYSVNWACGQECAIRLINTLISIQIINSGNKASSTLKQFVISHLNRIEAAVSYAIAQDNNHGTSEAAGLYIGGTWLETLSDLSVLEKQDAERWKNKGQQILEERVGKLVADDGSFSMYSTNYHRVVLNTVSIVEFWRRQLNLTDFTLSYKTKCKALCTWLYLCTDSLSGNAPNLGANDGSNPFIVQISLDFRDYRPAIQFAAYLFYDALAYKENPLINEPLGCFDINIAGLNLWNVGQESKVIWSSGLVVFRPNQHPATHAFLKFPVSRFRPSQADLLHFDLWVNGENILRDAGSYSYSPDKDQDQLYFSSIAAHNTIQIDDDEPMPKLSPFLFGNWIKMSQTGPLTCEEEQLFWQGEYLWPTGASHQRKIHFKNNKWIVNDIVNGAKRNIILRWRLKPANWVLIDNVLSVANISISINELLGCKFKVSLMNAYESCYYNLRTQTPMLVIETESNQVHFVTEISV